MKKLICTILLGTALVGSGAWAATAGVGAPVGGSGASVADANTSRLTRSEISKLSMEQRRAKRDELLKAHPMPVYSSRPLTSIDLKPYIEEFRKINEGPSAEKREEYNDQEILQIQSIEHNIFKTVILPWYKENEKRLADQQAAYTKWAKENPDIISLDRNIW